LLVIFWYKRYLIIGFHLCFLCIGGNSHNFGNLKLGQNQKLTHKFVLRNESSQKVLIELPKLGQGLS